MSVRMWLGNWRNLVGIGAIIVAGSMAGELAYAEHSRSDLRDTLQSEIAAQGKAEQIAAADRTRANAEIAALEGVSTANGLRIGQLLAEVQALQGQVAGLGGRPVIIDTGPPATASTAPSPAPSRSASTTTTRPAPSPQPSPRPRPKPAPCPSVLGLCLP